MNTILRIFCVLFCTAASTQCGAPHPRDGDHFGEELVERVDVAPADGGSFAGRGGSISAGVGGNEHTDGGANNAGGEGGAGGTSLSGGTTGASGPMAGGGRGGTGGMAAATGSSTGTGGNAAMGGSTGTGGNAAMGGSTGTGGNAAMGGSTGTGGTAAMGGSTGTGGTAASDSGRFHFENSAQGWRDLTRRRPQVVSEPAVSSRRSLAGAASLQYSIATSAAEERLVGVVSTDIGPLVPGAKVTYHLWVPSSHGLDSVQAFMQTTAEGSWRSDYRHHSSLQTGAWNAFTVFVPTTYADQDPLELGFYFRTSGAWSGQVWIDSVRVE